MSLLEFKNKKDCLQYIEDRAPNIMKIYSPFPDEELMRKASDRGPKLSAWTLIGALLGVSTGLAIQVWPNMLGLPQNAGGRPLFSYPAFFIPCLELGFLFGAFATVAGFLYKSKFPAYHEEAFKSERFRAGLNTNYYVLAKNTEINDETTYNYRSIH